MGLADRVLVAMKVDNTDLEVVVENINEVTDSQIVAHFSVVGENAGWIGDFGVTFVRMSDRKARFRADISGVRKAGGEYSRVYPPLWILEEAADVGEEELEGLKLSYIARE